MVMCRLLSWYYKCFWHRNAVESIRTDAGTSQLHYASGFLKIRWQKIFLRRFEKYFWKFLTSKNFDFENVEKSWKISKNRRKFQLKSNFFDFSIFLDFSRFSRFFKIFMKIFENIFSKSSPAKIYKSIWMILGPWKSCGERASNAPNPIDFLSLKPKLSRIPCGDHLVWLHFPFF